MPTKSAERDGGAAPERVPSIARREGEGLPLPKVLRHRACFPTPFSGFHRYVGTPTVVLKAGCNLAVGSMNTFA